MPPQKKSIRDQLSRLNGRLPSPKKAIKRVAAIALSPVKIRPEKKRRNDDTDHKENDARVEAQAPASNEDVLTDPIAEGPSNYSDVFHQGSTPEPPTAAPRAFELKSRLKNFGLNGVYSAHSESLADDQASVHTFPAHHAPYMLASDDDDDLIDENIPPQFDELCVPDAGCVGGY
ncbi:hypothetical protein C8J57DRAFT_1228146 [Mycena rebaudengoi]|nr:hypothetical protein C8J57DRAFT_1228146 [Mycena rebaudengoi]